MFLFLRVCWISSTQDWHRQKGYMLLQQKLMPLSRPQKLRMSQSLGHSCVGLVNYFGKFIKNLSTLTHSLNSLLHKRAVWNWPEYWMSFQTLKKKLAFTEVLVHYHPQLPIKLDCDASAYCIDFPCISWQNWKTNTHIQNTDCPRTKLSVDWKESTSITVNGVKNSSVSFRHSFTLVIDHKPSTAILGPNKGLHAHAATTFQCWAYQILNQGKMILPVSVLNQSQIATLPVDAAKLTKATEVYTLF